MLALNLGLLLFYEFVCFKYDVNSDSAVKVLLANEIIETGEFFPRDWVYANGDIYAFFSHSLALPLIPIFGPGFITHAIVGLWVALALLLATWWLLHELAFPRWQRLAMVAMLASGISSYLSENLYGQATYGFIITLNLLVIATALRFARRFESALRMQWGALVAVAVLSTLISWNNPKRALVTIAAPFLVSCAVLGFSRLSSGAWSFGRLKRVPEFWLAVAHCAGFSLGAVLTAIVLERPITNADTAGAAAWLGPDSIWRNTFQAVLGLMAQLGGVPPAGTSVVSGWGVYEAFRLVLSVLLLWAAVQAVRSVLSSPAPALRFVGVFTVVSSAAAGLFYVFTTLPDMTSSLSAARYLVPSGFFALLLLPTRMTARPVEGGKPSLVTLGAIALTACCGFTTLALPGYSSSGRTWEEARARGDRRLELVAFLQEQGLRYGYATYWNSGALTLLSGGQLKVRQVLVEGVPVPNRTHVSTRWYRPTAWSGESFLLLTEGEFKRLGRPLLDSLLGQPTRTLAFREYRALVYPRNIAELAGWMDVEGEKRFEITPRSPHVIGRFTAVEAGGGMLSSNQGETGELLFGPYLWLPRGHYRVSFDVAAEGPGQAGILQITASQSSVTLATQALMPGARGWRALEFNTERDEKLVEFRLVTNGSGAISVYGTRIERMPR